MVPKTIQKESKPRSAGGVRSELIWRVISTIVYTPIVLLLIFIGADATAVLALLVGCLLALEWRQMVAPDSRGFDGRFGVYLVVCLASIVLAAFGFWSLSFLAIAVGVVLFLAMMIARRHSPFWAVGLPYLILPCVLFVWLRSDPEFGLTTALWVLFIVWAYDSGAYLVGTFVGGPTFWARISPNKTWSGIGGGVVCAGLAGALTAYLVDADPLKVVLLSAGLGLVGQFGDLVESALKRTFGVKDSGKLIPGHGGVLDRMDSVIAVIFVASLLTLIFGGQGNIWS